MGIGHYVYSITNKVMAVYCCVYGPLLWSTVLCVYGPLFWAIVALTEYTFLRGIDPNAARRGVLLVIEMEGDVLGHPAR